MCYALVTAAGAEIRENAKERVDMSEATIRRAIGTDREAIRRLVNTAFMVEQFLKKGDGDRLQETDGELETLMERGSFLLMEEEDAVIACVYLEPHDEHCYLGLLSIDPSRKGTGLGRKMNTAAEAFAREQGCRWMDLRVVSPRRTELVPLYLKLGYQETGRQEYPGALVAKMALPGHFIAMSKAL